MGCRLHNEPVLFNQCSVFYTAWKMRLSAGNCVYISGLIGFWKFWGLPRLCPNTSLGSKSPRRSVSILPPNSGYATNFLNIVVLLWLNCATCKINDEFLCRSGGPVACHLLLQGRMISVHKPETGKGRSVVRSGLYNIYMNLWIFIRTDGAADNTVQYNMFKINAITNYICNVDFTSAYVCLDGKVKKYRPKRWQ